MSKKRNRLRAIMLCLTAPIFLGAVALLFVQGLLIYGPISSAVDTWEFLGDYAEHIRRTWRPQPKLQIIREEPQP